MDAVRGTMQGDRLKIALIGRIDSGNAPDVESELMDLTKSYSNPSLVIDAQDLEYISSAGLRVLLRLRKKFPQLNIQNVSSEVYEILEMTGFCQMMHVERAYRVISIEGCEIIGQGANGTVYRIDEDNVVKVYNDPDSLDDIRHEREVARLALVLGIPTAISYEIVRVGDSFGSVFELLNARSFSKILGTEPDKMDWCVKEYVDLLNLIHGTIVPKGKLPDMRQTAIGWANFVKDYLPEEDAAKLLRLIEEVPEDDHMIHGDYHTKNLQMTGDEVLIIDMDTLAVGHPVFEIASMYNSFVGFGEANRSVIKEFLGFDADKAEEFLNRSLAAYLGTTNEDSIKKVKDKARVVGYARMIRRSIRRGGLEDPQKKAEIDLWKTRLTELLKTTDSIVFDRDEFSDEPEQASIINDTFNKDNEITVDATKENLQVVMDFVDQRLEAADCPIKAQMQIDIAVEEIFINIVNYAYTPDVGKASVYADVVPDKLAIIAFKDQGVPYNPLAKEDPDITLSAEQRQIGGLGIYMVKQSMDDVIYEFKDGSNILILQKELSHA